MDIYRKKDFHKSIILDQIMAPFCRDVSFGDPKELTEILYGRYVVEDFSYSDDYNYWIAREYLLEKVIPHKVAVFDAGSEMAEQPWFFDFIGESPDLWFDNLWLHDLSKFSANEVFGYAFHDFKSDQPDIAFDCAWIHHKNHNEHHPEYWLNVGRDGMVSPVRMPKIFVAEMVADWLGAGKTYGATLEEWLPKNISKFRFSPQTVVDLKEILGMLGIKTIIYFDTSLDGTGYDRLVCSQ